MRSRASRLLELATRSRCEGRLDFAALLTDLAREILEHARDIEERHEQRQEQRHESRNINEGAKQSSEQDVA
jgi:formate dehydrogenase maturation protein FdhE